LPKLFSQVGKLQRFDQERALARISIAEANLLTHAYEQVLKHMKTKITLLVMSSSLVLAMPAVLAQSTDTNAFPFLLTNDIAAATDRLGERSLLPPGLKEKMKLTNAQRTDLKPIEDGFATTSQQYQAANQSRIDSAQEAGRRARASKDPAQIRAARKQLQDIWVGLHRDREAAVHQVKPLLTPDQLKILEETKNQWHENHADEVNDPSAK
jgi:hypothetical protein